MQKVLEQAFDEHSGQEDVMKQYRYIKSEG